MLKLRILEFPLFETSESREPSRADNLSIKANNRVLYCKVPEARLVYSYCEFHSYKTTTIRFFTLNSAQCKC